MHAKQIALLTLAVAVLLSMGACGGLGPPAGDPLEGTFWVLRTYGGAGLIPGTEITLTFEEGQVRGSSGCNTYGGSYEVDGDKITMSDLYMTEMACLDPEGVMDQELEYLELLRDAQAFQVDEGELVIEAATDEVLAFARAQ